MIRRLLLLCTSNVSAAIFIFTVRYFDFITGALGRDDTYDYSAIITSFLNFQADFSAISLLRHIILPLISPAEMLPPLPVTACQNTALNRLS